MKYFIDSDKKEKIILITERDSGGDNRVLSIKREDNGEIRFREECDKWFFGAFSKEQAIGLLQEAIDWIKKK